MLIYTNGSLKEHHKHVNKVLEAMGKARLPLDIKKCEFDTKSTKYLGFIIEAGKGLRMDPKRSKQLRIGKLLLQLKELEASLDLPTSTAVLFEALAQLSSL